ncbi:unnamed protein product, partial [Closterium sp. NIES-54]
AGGTGSPCQKVLAKCRDGRATAEGAGWDTKGLEQDGARDIRARQDSGAGEEGQARDTVPMQQGGGSTQGLADILGYKGAAGFREEGGMPGEGMVYDHRTKKWEEPTALERELAMGYGEDITKAEGVTEQERRKALGQAMDGQGFKAESGFMASSHHGSVERGAGSAQGGTPGSPPRPMHGRVGDGPAGAGACFVGGFLSVAAPTSRHSFRYSGPRPPPSGQTQPESGSGEEDEEEEEGEGEEDEDHEGSGDDSEAGWDPETHGGGKEGDDEEDHEMDGLEPEEVEEGVGEGGERAATEAASQHVAEGGGSVGVKVGIKRASIRMPKWRKRVSKLRERAYPCTFAGKPLGEGVVAPEFLDEDGGERHFESYHTAHMHVWHHRYHTPSVQLPGETFPRGGYKGVPDGYVDGWPHAKSWPHLAKKKGTASGGAPRSGGMERFMTTKLSTEELRQAIAKLVVTCDLPFRIVESEANFIPSRWMVSRDTVVYATAALQSAIAEMLAKEGELGCKVSITIDMWTAPNNKAWLVVTGHWIDESFQLRTMMLEFREMLGRHGGREMAQVVEETIVQWGLEGRCLGFTTDNASSNIAAFRRMSEEGGGQCFFSSRMHFRCLAHVINLAVQAALAVDSIRKLLKILREMASWIGFSPQRSGSFLGLQRTLNSQANPATPKPALKLVQDSPTRWGSTHDMVERAGVLQNPITVFFAQTQVSKAAEGAAYPTVSMVVPYYNGLIDAMESRLAKGPSPTLQPMIVAALSHLKKYAYITSNEYWIATFFDPSMKVAWFDDAHWEKLHPETERRVRPRPASGEVIKLVRDRVAEYQARAAELAPRPTPLAPVAEDEDGDEEEEDDDAQFLPSRRRLAARLSASQQAGAGGMVQDDEVSSATNMQTLRRMARDYLAIPATSASTRGRTPRPTPLAPVAEDEDGDEEEEDDDAQFLPSRRRLAARLSASQQVGAGGMVQDDEVSRYLSERVRCDVTALEYWRSATNMQTLRRMARDYLAIPATSASSERVFSLGRNLISWKRHRLASQRTRAVMILRSWYSSHPGQRIGEGRRPRGVAPPEFAIEGEGAEEDDEEEEEEGVEADDTAGGEDAVVGSSSAVAP